MKASGLHGCQHPKNAYKRAVQEHVAIPNYLKRQFNVTQPNPTRLAVAMSLFSGQVSGGLI